jgi:hypothetical protein
MIYIWNHEIARQRQQELLAAAERYRLGRIARDQKVLSWAGCSKKAYAALLARVSGSKHRSSSISPVAPAMRRR